MSCIMNRMVAKSSRKFFVTTFIITLGAFSFFNTVHAQEQVPDEMATMKAQVLKVISQQVETVPSTNVKDTYQTLQVQILDGAQKGQTVTVENDAITLKVGDIFYLSSDVNTADGSITYSVSSVYRLP